ncbi:transcription termination factor Rho [Synergistes jonesii]|uniref:Transcription termination factor Rho n=1 Tax=Synergistes jonesii TaxID=2754 RepID=A0A073J1A0_9BACT|nr:transcription termination factor Rho [Synergistes jonesii]
MPRRKKEPTDESAVAVKRRYVRKGGAENAEEAQPADTEERQPEGTQEGQEEAVVRRRTYTRRKKEESAEEGSETEAPAEEAEKPRRGRRRKSEEDSGQTLLPFERPSGGEDESEETQPKRRRGRISNKEKERLAALASGSAEKEEGGALAPEKGGEEAEAAIPEEAGEKDFTGRENESAEEEEAVSEEEPQPYDSQENGKGQIRHEHPKLTFNQLDAQTLAELRKIAKKIGVASVTTHRKDDLINDILKTQAESLGYRFNGGTLECTEEGYGFLRPSGLLPSSNDIYVSASQIRRFGLRNGDVVWGVIRPPKDQEHYEAMLRVENVNFTDPEAARHRPHFENLTPIFPTEKLRLETDRRQLATRIVDIFAPIGKGQRALIVSPPKAGKTTLLKNIAHSVTTNHPEVILMVLLIDERPEEVTDMARSVDGEIIASTFDRPAEEHLRVAKLALEKAKRLVEVSKDVVLLLDSITRLARASNLVVPPSGRTLSGGMDPAALYFPKKFFGAARNIENGGSLTIIGTSLVETGSRMDDVIYEEFKGTGNMEVHLSRKISELRIFPALDITRSGTRKEELMVPEDDLKRIWALRRKIANMDEAEVLNLILEKLRITPTNRDFLATIKVG